MSNHLHTHWVTVRSCASLYSVIGTLSVATKIHRDFTVQVRGCTRSIVHLLRRNTGIKFFTWTLIELNDHLLLSIVKSVNETRV